MLEYEESFLIWLLTKWLSSGLEKDKIEYVEMCEIYDYVIND